MDENRTKIQQGNEFCNRIIKSVQTADIDGVTKLPCGRGFCEYAVACREMLVVGDLVH